jgi:NAD(P)-dependent dehydrogenase (short-subunit alcohol dehydrogenase family)
MAQDVQKLFNLKGKTAVITGGGGDLCGNMAEVLGTLGVNVAILDKDGAKAENRKQTIDGGFTAYKI